MIDSLITRIEVALNFEKSADGRTFVNVDPLRMTIVVADDEDRSVVVAILVGSTSNAAGEFSTGHSPDGTYRTQTAHPCCGHRVKPASFVSSY
jgi:hypothetical protein